MSAKHLPVSCRSVGDKYRNEVRIGAHTVIADEPPALGGDDEGARPMELLMAALAACTSMTLQIYARRKQWPLQRVEVDVTHESVRAESLPPEQSQGREGAIDRMHRTIRVFGPLDAEQTERLLEIANKCPVHKALTRGVIVESQVSQGV